MTDITRKISAYRGCLLANRFLLLILVVVQLDFVIAGYRSFTPLYMIVLSLVFPLAAEGIIKSRSGGTYETKVMPNLQKKYKYTLARAKAQSYTFLLNVIMIALWRYGYAASPASHEIANSFPAAVMAIYVIYRIVMWIIYLLIFKLRPDKLIK